MYDITDDELIDTGIGIEDCAICTNPSYEWVNGRYLCYPHWLPTRLPITNYELEQLKEQI